MVERQFVVSEKGLRSCLECPNPNAQTYEARQSARNTRTGQDNSRSEYERGDDGHNSDNGDNLGSNDGDSIDSEDSDTLDLDDDGQGSQDSFGFDLASDDESLGWSDFEVEGRTS